MSMVERLERFGFFHGMTGGGCTAYIKTLPDGAEVYINLVDEEGAVEGEAPRSESALVCIGAYPVRALTGQPVEAPVLWWNVELDVFLNQLETNA